MIVYSTNNINDESILNNLRIFSIYHSQCDLVSYLLLESYTLVENSTDNGLRLLDNCVRTVSSFQ